MDDKFIVIIDTQDKKNKIKYFYIDNINKPVIKYTIFNDIRKDDKIDKFVLNKKGDKTFWILESSNFNKKNLIFEINRIFKENKNIYYKNIACVIIKNADTISLISNKIIEKSHTIKKCKYSIPLNIKFNILHNIVEKYIKNNKQYHAIKGGVKDKEEKAAGTNLKFNPLANPFNFEAIQVAHVALTTPKPTTPTTPTTPTSPKLSRECLNILRQEHARKKEYMRYNSYRYHDEYILFKEYNEINIVVSNLDNITIKRKGKPIQQAEIESNRNGMTNIGAILYNNHKGSNPPRIGTIIAANSGRPGGACGNFDGTIDKIYPNHRTQEEDIVSNWFMTYVYNKYITEGEKEQYYNKLFRCTIYNKWGLQYPYAKKTDKEKYYKTIQDINYSDAIPKEYADAWTIDNVYLSDKNYHYKGSQYIHEHQYKTTLVFVSGPNNNNPGTKGPINSVSRTYNEYTDNRFDVFMKGVEAALFAGLIAMVRSKCNVALLVYVSGGVYRGNHDKGDYKIMYENIVNNLLMNVQINGLELGSYFDAVYLL